MRLLLFRLAMALLLSNCVFSALSASGGTRRIYVEPFTTIAGATGLRNDVLAQLGKLSTISIAQDSADADDILGGGGEIWIKGYRSHNPELGKVAPNGTPIYNGYLSVELRNKAGETLWSYLATPPAASTDVSRDLATSIVNKLSVALQTGIENVGSISLPQPTETLNGAGATFPYPVYKKWFRNYRLQNPKVEITYAPIGSEDGVRELLAHGIDFAGSDSPQAVRELAPTEDADYLFFPSVVGAVVPVVNLPGVQGDIAFTPQALAGIYLGTVKRWNDPLLRRANHGLHLPDLPIYVVHRADGSGTSYAWTDYLSRVSPVWKELVGVGLAPKWPLGQGATGNEGVAKLVGKQVGAIGYVEFIYALENHLNYGKVRNRDGEYVGASLESIAAAAAHTPTVGNNFKISIVDEQGDGVYPICSFTWIVVPRDMAQEAKREAMMRFLLWSLGPGQRQAAALGYLALPADLVSRETTAISKMH